MRGQKSRELGSVDYRHPLRTEDVFNGSIDDFSIASIALSLKAISLKSELLYDFGADDRLLFSTKDYQNIGESECMKAIQSLSTDSELAQILGLFYIAYAKNELSNVSFRLLNIAKPESVPMIVLEVALSTAVTDEDEKNGIRDEYGILYSRDGFRLLKAPKNVKTYKIKDGTKVVCDCAFWGSSLRKLVIPSSVTSIGVSAFSCCSSLREVVIPSSVTRIGECAFSNCSSLREVVIPSSVTSIGNAAFWNCSSLREVVIPSSVTSIGKRAFGGCSSLRKVVIPSSVTSIGYAAFNNCPSLQLSIKSSKFELIDNSIIVDTLKKEVILCLNNRSNIIIPSSVTSIGDYAFNYCSSLRKLVIPSSVTSVGNNAFWYCGFLRSIIVPKGQAIRFRELLRTSSCDLSIVKEQD